MAPSQKSEEGNSERGKGDKVITEDSLARETGDQLADHTHTGKDHDVNSRVRIEPEKVLVKQRIASQCRIENADMKNSLHHEQDQRESPDPSFPHIYGWGGDA